MATYINEVIQSSSSYDEESIVHETSPAGIHLPSTSGDRIVFVDDNGLIDSGEGDYDSVELLTAEFRHRLGLLPEEEQELSEVFKASIGLSTFEPDRLESLSKDKEGTVENYKFETFAVKYFSKEVQFSYNPRPLLEPILSTKDEFNRKAAPLIWTAIHRFLQGSFPPQQESPRIKTSVMTRVCHQLNPRLRSSTSSTSSSVFSPSPSPSISEIKSPGFTSQKSQEDQGNSTSPKSPEKKSKWSIKKLMRLSSSDKQKKSTKRNTSTEYDGGNGVKESSVDDEGGLDDYEDIPTSELDLVHYVIAHGIMKSSLRDEILSQLCCQVKNNPSDVQRERGWMLLALCAGCFLPSSQMINFFFAFLHEAPQEVRDFARYIMVMLRRTNANGTRYHPPSWVELQAVKLRKYPVMQVGLADGRIIPVESDPATTAWEICLNVANTVGIKDNFGFSIYVGVQKKISSLGAGSDHVMDAISECEQMLRVEQGISENVSSWRIYYQKELFTPWNDPDTDQEATNLIYHQIIDGIRRGEYTLVPEEVPKLVSRIFYVEHGTDVDSNLVKSKLDDYLPKALLTSSRARDSVAKSILTAYETRGYGAGLLTTIQIKNQVVSIATGLWPLNYSAMFEAYRHAGPRLPRNDVILAVNGEGVFVLDGQFKTLLGFHYYDIVDCYSTGVADVRKAIVSFITIDGAQFSFYCPNSDTVAKIVSVFLEGLRRRSKWGVTLQSFHLHDYTGGTGVDFRIRQGDIVELLDESQHAKHSPDWLYGRCERTKVAGSFPYEVVYVLPSSERPDEKFLNIFRSMAPRQMDTLPKRKSAVILSSGTIGRHDFHGLESSA